MGAGQAWKTRPAYMRLHGLSRTAGSWRYQQFLITIMHYPLGQEHLITSIAPP
ncbi:MAG: hypothetical protein JO125_16950 [Chloroflexi bacterium]|nr:hypothetical protein [Chloroflexota bacterium]